MLPSSSVDADTRQGRQTRQEPDSSPSPPPKSQGKRRRNVIESSPSQGEAQLDDPNGNDDELDDLINSQLISIEEAEPDDPQVDWRTQATARANLPVDEDILSEPDELPEVEVEPPPPRSLKLIEDAISLHDPMILEVHARYLEFLVKLCEKTETIELTSHVRRALPHVVRRAQSIALNKDLTATKDLDSYALGLVVYVWLVVALGMQHGVPPSESLVLGFGSYMLSAHAIVADYCNVSFKEHRLTVLYWERRLENAPTRIIWSKEGWFRNIMELPLTKTSNRNDTATEYTRVLNFEGKARLANLIMKKAAASHHNTPLSSYTGAQLSKRSWALSEIITILATMDTDLLTALIDGSLPRKAEVPLGAVSNALQRMSEQKPMPPSIYMNCISDRMGISPTPFHWQTVCHHMMLYVSGGAESDALAGIVDQLIYPNPKWPQSVAQLGLRRYTEWRSYIEGDGDRYPSHRHRHMVRHFVTEMQARIDADVGAGKGSVPFAAPVIEIGFSINPVARLKEHRQHHHSNYLMNLSEAMFQHLYPDSFRLQQLVIYTCHRPSHPWFGEIIFTQLAQGYTEDAGGFSHYPAGRSNGSAYNRTSKSDWTKYGYEARRSGNLRRELEGISNHAKTRYQLAVEQEKLKKEAGDRELELLDQLDDLLESTIDAIEESNHLSTS